LLRIFFSLVFIALSLGIAAGGASPQRNEERTASHSPGKHITAVGLPNFGEVTPKLYRGGQPTAAGFERLAKMGVGIVVDFGKS
jgi:hypothetical protein